MSEGWARVRNVYQCCDFTVIFWGGTLGGGGGTYTCICKVGVEVSLESLLEHVIFLNFLGGAPPNPPQGEVATHKYSHHKISNPAFTNPMYTHVITAL